VDKLTLASVGVVEAETAVFDVLLVSAVLLVPYWK
jgi:hypothetical protein